VNWVRVLAIIFLGRLFGLSARCAKSCPHWGLRPLDFHRGDE
jgi:hypothetical protein